MKGKLEIVKSASTLTETETKAETGDESEVEVVEDTSAAYDEMCMQIKKRRACKRAKCSYRKCAAAMMKVTAYVRFLVKSLKN